MDALSTAASLIALKLSGSAILLSGYRKSKYSGAKYLEFKIFVDVLDDISQIPLSSLDATTTAVQPCIVLCQTRLHFLESLLSRSGAESLGSKEGEKAVVEFIRSVKILRDIVMEFESHPLN